MSSINRRDFIKLSAMGSVGIMLEKSNILAREILPFKPIKVGVVGLDTSHSVRFTEVLNDPKAPAEFSGCPVVAAYPKGSLDIKSSVSRISKYTREMKKMGVDIVDSVDELLDRVDAVLLETNDGRRHLEQAMEVFEAGKPVFIDKPLAASLTDVIAIFDAAETYNVPMFSSSSLRYIKGAQAVRNGKIGKVMGANTYSPAAIEPTHPDLFWYGIHGVEALFTVMGTGCEKVVRIHTDDTDVVVGTWNDGRIGTFRGRRSGKHRYGGTAFGINGEAHLGPYGGYHPLLKQIVKFFRTGRVPVDSRETKEIYAFMSAAKVSKNKGGEPVDLRNVVDKARNKIKF